MSGCAERADRGTGTWLLARPRAGLLGALGVCVGALVGLMSVSSPKMAIALVLATLLAITLLVRPALGGYVLAGVVPVTSGLRAGFPIPHLRVSELLIGAVFLVLVVSARRAASVSWGALDLALLAFGIGWAVCGAADAAARGQSLSLSDLGTLVGQFQWLLIYRGMRLALRTSEERERGFLVLVAASVPVSLLAIGQQLHVSSLDAFLATATGSKGLTSTGIFQRATGPFGQWTVLAGYLFPVIVPLVALGIAGIAGKRRRALLVVVCLDLVALALTAELSAIVMLVVSVVALGVWAKRAKRILSWLGGGALAGAAIIGPFLAQRITTEFSASHVTGRSALIGQTLAFRMWIWQSQYLPAILGQPLSGYGVILPAVVSWPYPESQYVGLLMEGGVIVLGLFAVLTWVMLASSTRAAKSSDSLGSALGRSLAVMTVLIIPMDAIWPYMSNAGMPQVLFCLFGLLPAAGRLAGSSAASPAPAPVARRPSAPWRPPSAALEPWAGGARA